MPIKNSQIEPSVFSKNKKLFCLKNPICKDGSQLHIDGELVTSIDISCPTAEEIGDLQFTNVEADNYLLSNGELLEKTSTPLVSLEDFVELDFSTVMLVCASFKLFSKGEAPEDHE